MVWDVRFVECNTEDRMELTPEIKTALDTHAQEWRKIGLRTEPADCGKVTQVIKDLYTGGAGFKAPFVVLTPSPMSIVYTTAVAGAFVQQIDDKQMTKKAVLERIASCADDCPLLAEFVWRCFTEEEPPFKYSCEETRDTLIPSLKRQAYTFTDTSITHNYLSNWSVFYQGGNCWAGSDGYITAMRDVMGAQFKEQEKYKFWEEAARNSSMRMVHRDFCVVSDFPEKIKIDEEGRPHSSTGESHKWRDGYCVSHWHGTKCDNSWLDDSGTLTPGSALRQSNAELRRVACEILGWDKVLEDPSLNPRIIDEDEPWIGTLIEVDLPEAEKQRFIKFQCGTGRWFAEPVNDPEYDTALKANAGGNGWRPGMKSDPESFIPIVRT